MFITISSYYPEKRYFPPLLAVEVGKKFFVVFFHKLSPFNVFVSVFRSPRNLNLRLGRESKIGLMEGAEARKSQSRVASSLTHLSSFSFPHGDTYIPTFPSNRRLNILGGAF